ncbi:hypothetical protein B0H13DRAFT_1890771 [Mycena leptocephala]|nr:hypothetical protein B0H13DRAFT_1890771 [Mycena leptocephala]
MKCCPMRIPQPPSTLKFRVKRRQLLLDLGSIPSRLVKLCTTQGLSRGPEPGQQLLWSDAVLAWNDGKMYIGSVPVSAPGRKIYSQLHGSPSEYWSGDKSPINPSSSQRVFENLKVKVPPLARRKDNLEWPNRVSYAIKLGVIAPPLRQIPGSDKIFKLASRGRIEIRTKPLDNGGSSDRKFGQQIHGYQRLLSEDGNDYIHAFQWLPAEWIEPGKNMKIFLAMLR